jgi:hypothetical protein
MLNSAADFSRSISEARQSTALFDHLVGLMGGLATFDDILRFQLVYSVSAFDKLLHDLIRIGMRDCFVGVRQETARYKAETIGLEFHAMLAAKIAEEVTATIQGLPPPLPPKQVLFEQEIQRKLSFLAFQDPDKISEGLAMIWDATHKWDKIAVQMGVASGTAVRTQMRLIVSRRNSIVHEADFDPVLALKRPITRQTVAESTDFVENCGSAIVQLVL